METTIKNLKPIRPIESYSIDELKRLYKSFLLYITTDYMSYCARYKGEMYIYNKYLRDEKEYMDEVMFARIWTNELKLENELYKDEKEKTFLRNELSALKLIRNTRKYWIDELTEEELEININDDIDGEYGRATELEIITFIWETLRFCNYEELRKLVKYADNKFKINQAHRPSFNKKIYKYDLEGNLITEFDNREECIKNDGIRKNALSMVLSGKRKQYKGYRYIEEE